MPSANTLLAVCRQRNSTIRQLAVLVGEKPADLIFASQKGIGSSLLRQRIAEAFGVACWEDLFRERKRIPAGERLHMSCLVILPEPPVLVLRRCKGIVFYKYDGCFYVQWHTKSGSLTRVQYFNAQGAFEEYLCAIARHKEE